MDQRPIIFGPGDKLRWLEAVASDQRATAFDVRVAVAISNRIDKFTGTATIGQVWLAEFIRGTDRGVRKSADHLEEIGHLNIVRSEGKTAFGGRGKANVYAPKTRNGATQNPERHDTKPRTAVPPLPKRLPNILPNGGGGSSNTVLGEHPEGDWRTILSVLGNHLDHEIMRGWFADIDLEAMDDNEAVLSAPSQFKRTYVQNHFEAQLLSAARRCRPTIKSVRVVVRNRKAVR